MPKAKTPLTSDTCPPLLRAVIEKAGGDAEAVATHLGVAYGTLRQVVNGSKKMSDKMQAHLKAMAESGGAMAGHGGPRQLLVYSRKEFPNCPPRLAEALERNDGNFSPVADAIGTTRTYVIGLARDPSKVSRRMAENIEAYLEGKPVPIRVNGKEAHTNLLGFFLFKDATFEEAHDICLTMKGEIAFKRKAGTYWMAVIRMARPKFLAFKTLAEGYGAEVWVDAE